MRTTSDASNAGHSNGQIGEAGSRDRDGRFKLFPLVPSVRWLHVKQPPVMSPL